MNNNKFITAQLGKKIFPELKDVIDIRDILMNAAEKNIPAYKHEGSGAGIGGADFSFFLNNKIFSVVVEEIE